MGRLAGGGADLHPRTWLATAGEVWTVRGRIWDLGGHLRHLRYVIAHQPPRAAPRRAPALPRPRSSLWAGVRSCASASCAEPSPCLVFIPASVLHSRRPARPLLPLPSRSTRSVAFSSPASRAILGLVAAASRERSCRVVMFVSLLSAPSTTPTRRLQGRRSRTRPEPRTRASAAGAP